MMDLVKVLEKYKGNHLEYLLSMHYCLFVSGMI